MVTPQKLKMACGKTNEINGDKKLFFVRLLRKKCLLLIRSEKIVRLSWELKKSLITKKNHSPPRIQLPAPNQT